MKHYSSAIVLSVIDTADEIRSSSWKSNWGWDPKALRTLKFILPPPMKKVV